MVNAIWGPGSSERHVTMPAGSFAGETLAAFPALPWSRLFLGVLLQQVFGSVCVGPCWFA
jgi:hypothetical protein